MIDSWLNLHQRARHGVQVYISPTCPSIPARIEISAGTRVADEHELKNLLCGFSYEEGARIPHEPWRLAYRAEKEILLQTKQTGDIDRLVSVVSLPFKLLVATRDAVENRDDDAIRLQILDQLKSVILINKVSRWLVSRNPGGLKTVTVNQDIGHYIGLHVDNWENHGLHERDRSGNRLCANIGHHDRYFLFLPISLMDMVSILTEELGSNRSPPDRLTLLGRQFMQRFPDFPVVRCRLRPGEAYIAPTENLVHDGSSIGQESDDELLTIWGRIRPL